MKSLNNYYKLLSNIIIKVTLLLFVIVLILIFFYTKDFRLENLIYESISVIIVGGGFYLLARSDIVRYENEVNVQLMDNYFFNKITTTSPFAIIITDGANIIYYNDASKNLFKRSSKYMEVCSIYDLIVPKEREKLKDIIGETVVGAKNESATFQINNTGELDEEIRFCSFNIQIQEYKQGYNYVIFAFDITDYYYENNLLHNNVSVFKEALNNLSQVVSLFDSNGGVVFLNETAKDNPQFMGEDNFLNIIEYDINRNLLNTGFNIAISGDKYLDEKVIRHSTEGNEWANIMFAPIETQQGDTFVEFVLDDITEYKNKVVHFENLDEIYKFTFQTSKIPQIRWDQDGNFVMANKSFYDLFYLPENYFDGKEINIFNTDLKNIMVFNDITFFDAEGYVYSKHSKQSIPAGLKKYYSKVMNAESVNVLVNFDITPLLKKYRIALSPENVDNAQHLWLRHFVHPVITNHGQLSSVLFEFYDIHKYIELQNKYNISNSYLQAIANNFYSGIIFIVDINNKIVFFGGEEEVKVRLQIFTTNYTQLMMDLTTLPQISNLRDNVFAALNGNYSRIVAEIFDNTYDFQFFPIRNKDGKIEFCMGIGFNITERENYENQLVFQKNFLDRTFTESPIPTIIIDKSGKINRANIRYFQLVGITPDRYDELDVYNEDSWLNKEIIVSSFKNSLKGQSIQFEVSEERTFMLIDDDDVDADEYIFTLNCRSYPIFNNQNVVENVVMNFIDVSDTKALIDGMTKSNAINNIVTSNYPDGILMILDKNFKFILFEGKEEIELIKMNKIRVVGNNLNTFESVITDKIKPYILEVVENKQKINFDFSIEITAELTFPITAYYEVSVIPILDIQKDIEYIYLCLKNITNRKQLEQTILEFNSKLEAEVTQRTAQLKETTYDLEVYVAELQSTQDKLLKAQNELSENLDKEVELNQMKSQFISLMSHEFRTPLTIIQTYIYLMETYYEVQMKDKFDGSVQKVLGSIELMTKLLDNILFLDDVKEHIVVFLQFDIVGFVKTLIDSSVESLKAEQNIILNSDKEIYMFSDDKLLTNIVTNLLSNAIKYSPKTADIIIDIINDTKTLTFSVQDFGNGISDDVVDKIFDSFVRSSDFTNISGSGLGLSLVKSCVNLLKGKVSFETEKAKGSKFIVTLPKFTEEEVHKIMESQSKDSE